MRTFLVMLLAYALSQFYRSFLAVVSADLSAEIGLGPQDLGNMSAMWFATFAVSQFGVGWGLDRIGPRRTVTCLMLFAVAGAVLLAEARSTQTCLLAMALIGIGSSPIYMSALYLFGRNFPPARFAFLSSLLLGIGSAGNLAAAAPLAWAAETIGWRPAFLCIAATTLVSAGLILLLIRDPERAVRPEGAHEGAWSGLLQAALIPGLRPLLPLVLVSYAIVVAERALWVGPYFREVHRLGAIDTGNAVLAMAAAMSLGAIAYGPLDQILGTRKRVVAVGTLVTTALLAALALLPGLTSLQATALMAAFGGCGMTYAVLMAHARGFMPAHLLGRGITFVNFLFFSGAMLVQLGSGRLVEHMRRQGLDAGEVYGWLHLAFAAAMGLSLAVYLFSREPAGAAKPQSTRDGGRTRPCDPGAD